MQLRVDFLLSQGLRPEEVGRAALAHPQVSAGARRSPRRAMPGAVPGGLRRRGAGERPGLLGLGLGPELGHAWSPALPPTSLVYLLCAVQPAHPSRALHYKTDRPDARHSRARPACTAHP